MNDFKYGDCCGIQEVIVNSEPNHVFEYEKTANRFADEVDGTPVAIYYSSKTHLWACEDNDLELIGYGVEKDGELL